MDEQKIRVLELFAGIGACSKALTNLGIEHEIVDAVEIDKYAIKSFNAIHGTNFEPQDITTWNKDIECDLIMHGSPCQDFSVAGRGAGGDKDSGTRSSLMYETLRIVEKLRPKYVVWENVKNLLSKKHRHNFDAYLDAMADMGYINNYKVLNAKVFLHHDVFSQIFDDPDQWTCLLCSRCRFCGHILWSSDLRREQFIVSHISCVPFYLIVKFRHICAKIFHLFRSISCPKRD